MQKTVSSTCLCITAVPVHLRIYPTNLLLVEHQSLLEFGLCHDGVWCPLVQQCGKQEIIEPLLRLALRSMPSSPKLLCDDLEEYFGWFQEPADGHNFELLWLLLGGFVHTTAE